MADISVFQELNPQRHREEETTPCQPPQEREKKHHERLLVKLRKKGKRSITKGHVHTTVCFVSLFFHLRCACVVVWLPVGKRDLICGGKHGTVPSRSMYTRGARGRRRRRYVLCGSAFFMLEWSEHGRGRGGQEPRGRVDGVRILELDPR